MDLNLLQKVNKNDRLQARLVFEETKKKKKKKKNKEKKMYIVLFNLKLASHTRYFLVWITDDYNGAASIKFET